MTDPSTSTVTVSEARATLPSLVERVLAGDEITLTRHGVPVAVVVRPDAIRARRATDVLVAASALRRAIDERRRQPVAVASGLSAARADTLAASIRADRRSR